MTKIHILTLFPAMFHGVISDSIVAIAREKEQLDINLVDIRNFADNKHKQVDDYQFGGGAGMVLKPEPLAAAIESVIPHNSPLLDGCLHSRRGVSDDMQRSFSEINPPELCIVYFTPQGQPLTQKKVREFLSYPEIILICGHYKDIDQRIRDQYVTHEISIGDYVLSGGELPAMIFTDALARLLPDVLSDPDSALTDSHENGLLGYPCYTRPYDFRGMTVPDVLMSGHHARIQQWRDAQALQITQKVRPDLLPHQKQIFIGLVHYPVYNKTGETITSSITNLDIHDISRTARTYGVQTFFLIHPNQRQREIFEQIMRFWKKNGAKLFNKHRVDALKTIVFTQTIADTVNLIKNQVDSDPIIITTTAARRDGQIDFATASSTISQTKNPVLILFGTGNGLHHTVHENADFVLEPIQDKASYNHLSVRSAIAIVMDRLLAEV